MAKNVILNILQDEDTQMSFEEACPSNWQWLSYLLEEGGPKQVNLEELHKALAEYVAEVKKDQDDLPEWWATVDVAVDQFKKRLAELVSEEDFEMGNVVLKAGEWAVEYDHCFGVIIMIMDDGQEE